MFLPPKLPKGFTLIEVLVVAGIATFIVVSLVSNSLRTRVNVNETARTLVSDIRTAQANALSAKQYINPTNGAVSYRCGYGVSHVTNDTTGYFLYTGGTFNSGGGCTESQRYGGSGTPIVVSRIIDSRLEIIDNVSGSKFEDIYFEAPGGKIYIKNAHRPTEVSKNKSQILIRKKGSTCPSVDCVYVCVYSFGRIESRSTVCPDLAP